MNGSVWREDWFRFERDGEAVWANVGPAIADANTAAAEWWDTVVAPKLTAIASSPEFAKAAKLESRRAAVIAQMKVLNAEIADARNTCSTTVLTDDKKSDPRAVVDKIEDLRREAEGLRIVLDAIDEALPAVYAARTKAAETILADVLDKVDGSLDKKEVFSERMFLDAIQAIARRYFLYQRKCSLVTQARRSVDRYVEAALQEHGNRSA